MAEHLKRIGTPGQKAATRSLRKFCRDHGHAPDYIQALEQFEAALESRDVGALKTLIKKLRHAGMGSFIDWFPKPIQQTENDEYVETIWNALYGHWLEQVRPIQEAKDA
jgi:hypothetical protein